MTGIATASTMNHHRGHAAKSGQRSHTGGRTAIVLGKVGMRCVNIGSQSSVETNTGPTHLFFDTLIRLQHKHLSA